MATKQRTDLGNERAKAPWIHPQKNTCNITNYLMRAAQNHAPHKPRCFPSQAEIGVHDSGDCKQGRKRYIGCEGRLVAIYAHFDCTKLSDYVSGRNSNDNGQGKIHELSYPRGEHTSKVQLAFGPNMTKFPVSFMLSEWKQISGV